MCALSALFAPTQEREVTATIKEFKTLEIKYKLVKENYERPIMIWSQDELWDCQSGKYQGKWSSRKAAETVENMDTESDS